MKIRQQVSDILGVQIAKDDWDETFRLLDQENKLNSKVSHKILLVILKRLEELEEND